MVRTAFVTTAVLTRVGAEHDLSLTQLRVLGVLRDRRLRMAALADFLGLERSTMTGLVDRAERRGLLQRGPGGGSTTDGRAVHVALTAEGAALAERVRTAVGRALAPLTGALSGDAQRRLQDLLEAMLDTSDPERR